MKSYREFIKESIYLKKDIEYACDIFNILDYTINKDGYIDVDNNVYLQDEGLFRIPIKFSKVTGDFNLYLNLLTSLEGCPKEVGGDFNCYSNKITTLEYAPKIVVGNFSCESNKIISLEGGPTSVGGNFNCKGNQLTSLVGCPDNIGRSFNCEFNNITDFKGISEFFEGNFWCSKNPIEEIWKLFYDVRCIKFINEFDVIRGNTIILDRLEEIYHQLGIEIPENIKLNNYEII
jgi:hypothetical protein